MSSCRTPAPAELAGCPHARPPRGVARRRRRWKVACTRCPVARGTSDGDELLRHTQSERARRLWLDVTVVAIETKSL